MLAAAELRRAQRNDDFSRPIATFSMLCDTPTFVRSRRGAGIMGRATEQHEAQAIAAGRVRDWRKAMSDHVAYGLLVYTGLQIFVTVKALSEGTSGLLPYLALVVLVAGIIPALRWFERRWIGLDDDQAADEAYAAAFRRDTVGLWLMAIGLPFGLTLIFKVLLGYF